MKRSSLVLIVLTGLSWAQQPLTAMGANATFTDLERKLATAMQEKNPAAINELTADDYVVRTPEAPTEPVGRDTWESADLPNFDVKDFRITKMAVRIYSENTAVVSEKYAQTATQNGQDRSGDFWVIDVWAKHDGKWKLSERYISPMLKGPADLKLSKH
jgi:ketosteroid isomerase-like protein